MVDGSTHKAGLQLSRHLIITRYIYIYIYIYIYNYNHAITVEWMYTYLPTYCRCVPMRLTGGTLVLCALCSAYSITPYKNSISLYSIHSIYIQYSIYTVYIHIHIHTQAMFI